MKNKPLAVALPLLFPALAHAMGLRAFVALPVDKGGSVARLQIERNLDDDSNLAVANLALGISAKQAILLGLPYRLSPAGTGRVGDLGLLYRHIVWQNDFANGTRRIGLLGGVVVPGDSGRNPALQAGLVSTWYRNRHEWDIDLLYRAGLGQRPDSGRYDLSWQYRLSPANYPDWGVTAEWNSVLELGGRWTQGAQTIHQVTLGLQWIHPRWVLEGGIVRDINGPDETHLLLSTRMHF